MIGIHVAKCINPASRQKHIHPFSFFGQEAGRFFIAFGIMDIYLLVRNIVISHYHKLWPRFAKLLYILKKLIQPLVFVLLSFIAAGARREISIDHRDLSEIGTDHTPFEIALRDLVAAYYLVGRDLCKDGHTT